MNITSIPKSEQDRAAGYGLVSASAALEAVAAAAAGATPLVLMVRQPARCCLRRHSWTWVHNPSNTAGITDGVWKNERRGNTLCCVISDKLRQKNYGNEKIKYPCDVPAALRVLNSSSVKVTPPFLLGAGFILLIKPLASREKFH